MRKLHVVALWLVLLAAPGLPAAGLDLDAPLPVDPDIRMVELPNGLDLWMREHDTPPDRVGIWMHVDSGSLNETENQRGLAHFLEHMAFNGSEHFPPGELVKYFESLGLRFGQHQNAFTGYDQTTFTLRLPDTEKETISKGMLCMSDFAFRLSLKEEEVAKERGVVLEEIRARKGPDQRIIEKLLPIVLPGSRVARRRPIGKAEVIRQVDRPQVKAYYGKWYRPDNTTLLVVGDVGTDVIEELARKHFASWEPAEDPPREADPGVEPYTGLRTGVVTDPEVTETDVSAVSVRPLEKVRTVGEFRARLVDRLGNWIANRRLLEMLQKGTAPFQDAEVQKFPFLNACTYIDATATGKPDRWRPMMRALLTELKRARRHGFLAQELSNAKKAVLAAIEQAERTESTRDARSFLREMNGAVARDRKPMSAEQELELTRELIETVSLEEVAEAFRRNFDPAARLLLVIMPEKEDLPVPPEEDLKAVAEEVAAAEVEPPEEKELRESLLEEEPASGKVASREEEPDLGILSATLGNGFRVHLREMDFKKDQVFIRVVVGGGIIRETSANRGITGLTAQVLGQPASDALSSTQIQDILTGKNVSLSGSPASDALSFSVTSSTEDVEQAFQLAHLMLSRPRLEPSAADRWKEEMVQRIEKRRIDVGDQAVERMRSLLSGGDPRFKFPTRPQVEELARPQAQEWLGRLVRNGPVELAVVGDLERGRARELTVKYFGSLPERSRTDPELEALRELTYGEGPLEVTAEVPTITPRAVVITGWRGADWRNVKDRRILQIAGEILTSRLREEIREDRGLTYTIYCHSRAARAYPGTGLFAVYFTADPEKASRAAELARGVVEDLAASGPTEREMATVRKQFANILETSQKEPSYWVSVLSDLDYRGTRLDDVKKAMEQYTSYTREELMDVLGRYVTPERRLQVIALPTRPEKEEPAKPEPKPD